MADSNNNVNEEMEIVEVGNVVGIFNDYSNAGSARSVTWYKKVVLAA